MPGCFGCVPVSYEELLVCWAYTLGMQYKQIHGVIIITIVFFKYCNYPTIFLKFTVRKLYWPVSGSASKFMFNNTMENNTIINNINVKNKNKRKIT